MTHQPAISCLKSDTFRQQLANGSVPWAELEPDEPSNARPLSDRLAHLEIFIQNLDVYIYYGENTEPDDLYPACYIGATDTVGMPYPVEFFPSKDYRSILDYYRILFHEIGHWTRHPERLNRTQNAGYGTKAYAVEELTAELTSTFVLAQFEITEPAISDHENYLDKWQKIIAMFNGDTFSMTRAELQARKACEYLFSLQPNPS